ncbi:hypothetical protein QS257_12280 [Terrilactibacillus sp. S3-3]|nr:hypothetical protein QS257_12280 [Terrilactibacillus sp. S3-3]
MLKISENEKRLIQSYILLPLMRMALERDKKIIKLTNTKFKDQYINVLNNTIHQISCDLKQVKDEIFNQQIRMHRKNWLEYEAYIRGYKVNIHYHKSIAGDWIYDRIRKYLH